MKNGASWPSTKRRGTGEGGGLPSQAYAAALASVPGVGPAWLAELLAKRDPAEAWRLVLSGEVRPPARPRTGRGEVDNRGGQSAWALGIDVRELWGRCQGKGIQVTWPGEATYPSALVDAPGQPGVLFWSGDLGWVERCPVVSLVGTRRCTPEGARTAYELAYNLAAAGVCVVSGLALGIDGAAHAGALAAFEDASRDAELAGDAASVGAFGPEVATPRLQPGPAATVGVAASGVDVVYPRQHAALWRRVSAMGAVVSETPPGSFAQPWRFPARNRVIASLARMVVVIESHVAGGSWHTVDAALRAGVEVGAVPGSVHSAASDGTNSMLREGATPVRGAQDVLDALGLFESVPRRASGGRATTPHQGSAAPRRAGREAERPELVGSDAAGSPPPTRADGRPPGAKHSPSLLGPQPSGAGLGPLERKVLAALGWRPVCLEDVVERSGLPLTAAVVALERLEAAGTVTTDGGWWWRH